MEEAKVIKLNIKGSFNYSKCVNAFPTKPKDRCIEDLRKLVLTNKKTRVAYSDKLKKVTLRVAYGTEYIRFNTLESNATAYTYDAMDISKADYDKYKEVFQKMLETDVADGMFDEEIKRLSKRLSKNIAKARKKEEAKRLAEEMSDTRKEALK